MQWVGQMLDGRSLEYFRRRERAERAAAKQAASEAARRVHQELAQQYAALLREPVSVTGDPQDGRSGSLSGR